MRNWCCAGSLTLAIVVVCGSAHAEDRATQILNRVDDLYRSGSSRAVLSMTVKTKHYERTLEMVAWSKGKDKS